MKILHVNWGYPPRYTFGGPVYYLHCLAQSQMAAGHHVTIATASDAHTDSAAPFAVGEEIEDGVRYLHIVNRPLHMFNLGDPAGEMLNGDCDEMLTNLLDVEQPDVVHVHNLLGLSLSLPRLVHQRGFPVVSSAHNYAPICSNAVLFFDGARACAGVAAADCATCLGGTGIAQARYRARAAAGVASYDSADRVLAVSGRVGEILVAAGVDESRIQVQRIGSQVACDLWEQGGCARVEAARESACAEGAATRADAPPLELMFFGSQVPSKGPHVILEALARVRSDNWRMRFWGMGGGEAYEARLQGLLAALGPRGDQVECRGHYTQDELHDVLGGVDVAVLTPQWEDNGPQTVFEAQGAGCVVLGTRMGGVPEVAIDGVNAVLVPAADAQAIADAIDRLAEDRALLARLRASIAPPLSMPDHAQSTLDVYADVIAAHAAQPERALALIIGAGAGRAALLQTLAHLATWDVVPEIIVCDPLTFDGTFDLVCAVAGPVRHLRDRAAALGLARAVDAAVAPHVAVVPAGWTGSAADLSPVPRAAARADAALDQQLRDALRP